MNRRLLAKKVKVIMVKRRRECQYRRPRYELPFLHAKDNEFAIHLVLGHQRDRLEQNLSTDQAQIPWLIRVLTEDLLECPSIELCKDAIVL